VSDRCLQERGDTWKAGSVRQGSAGGQRVFALQAARRNEYARQGSARESDVAVAQSWYSFILSPVVLGFGCAVLSPEHINLSCGKSL
jgi:hypothetical protein